MSGDAYHMTLPAAGGAGAARCMQRHYKTQVSILIKSVISTHTVLRHRLVTYVKPVR
ncbi:hypothetical protein THIOSC13_30004 [uncultured Thiomicrorhabdus sp.]